MSAASKAKGTRYESEVAQWLQDQGIRAKRLPRAGVNDIGDIAFPFAKPAGVMGDQRFGVIVIEAKNRAALDWPTFLKEADVEADNYEAKYPAEGHAIGVVFAKRRGKGVSQSYVMLTPETFVDLLRQQGAV